jgi:hypothetical protein
MLMDEGLQKHTLNLFEGDYDKLRSFYPDVGAGAVIRRIVHRYIEQIEANGGASIDAKVEIKI